MKILMISYNLIGHGTYLRAYEMAKGLVQLGHHVSLIATAKQCQKTIHEWEDKGIHIIETPASVKGPFKSGFDPYNVMLRTNLVKEMQFDVVHGFESRPSVIYPALKLQKSGVPLILDWCDWFGKGGSVEERPNPLIRLFFRPIETYFENHFRLQADATTVICSTLYQKSLKLGVDPLTITLLPNGLNIHNWSMQIRETARDYFHYSTNDFVIGYIGALFPKDAKLMMEAFKLVIEKLPNANLLQLGYSNYNPDSKSINNSKLTITGHINDQILQKGLAACDICWLPLSDIPANWGRSPLKISDYLSAGKPVVITNVGDLPKLIQKHGAGIISSPNAKSLSSAIIKLAKSPTTLKSMSKAALTLSQQPEYSWLSTSKKLLAIYESLLKNK